jgi:tricorn protease
LSLAIDNKGDKPATFSDGIGQFALSADHKRLLLQKWSERGNGDLYIVDAGAKAPDALDKHKLRVADWRLAIDPRAEWQQMFNDAWRMHRQFSFDPNMRGLDWNAVRARYEPMLSRVADRWELDDLLGQMTAELGILHSQVRGGEMRKDAETAKAAGLGADLVAQADGLRIARIYRSDPELPSERAPLARPGVDAREGDVLTAINGRTVRNAADVAEALANQAGRQVLLDLRRGTQAMKTVAVPVDDRSEAGLRYGDWEQSRRERVLAQSDGRIGYLHLRAMGSNDIANFAREFYTNINREA